MGLLNIFDRRYFPLFRQLYVSLLLIIISIGIGVGGYMIIEHYKLADAFFMTIITISTVGLEVKPLSEAGRMFTAFYVISNIGIFTYAITSLVTFVVEGQYKDAFKNIRLKTQVDKLHGHIIICGFGRNGLQACQELAEFNIHFVVIESDAERVKSLEEEYHYPVITGDATSDEVLKQAGIDRARALVTTLPGDAENVYVVLTARGLNPTLKIISRASSESSEQKVKRAGADYVVIPEKIGGLHMARMIISRGKLPLIEDLFKYSRSLVGIKELDIKDASATFKQETVGSLNVQNLGAMVIGIKEPDGNYVLNAPISTRLTQAESLILLGDEDQLASFEQFMGKH